MKRKKKKKSFIGKLIKAIFILCIIVVAGFAVLIFADPLGLNEIKESPFDNSAENLLISPDVSFNEKILNVALIGIDRKKDGPSRSDVIIILSYDSETGRTMLTSVMRDLAVNIPPNNRYDKINAAYAFGGEERLLQTLNQNLDMNIQYYATVDFAIMEQLVDAVGGVEIDIKPEEVKHVNDCITEQCQILGGSWDLLTEGGIQTLNGRQALGYSRVRAIGHGDWERTLRQRRVLSQVLNKLKADFDLKTAYKLYREVLPMVQTNMESRKIVWYMYSFYKNRDTFILEDFRVPFDNHGENSMHKGVYYLKPTQLTDNVVILHQMIYGIDQYEPSDRVKEISKYIQRHF